MDANRLALEVMEVFGVTRAQDPALYQFLIETYTESKAAGITPSVDFLVEAVNTYGPNPPGPVIGPLAEGEEDPFDAEEFEAVGGLGTGYDFDQLQKNFGANVNNTGTRLIGAYGDPVIRAVNSSGKTYATFVRGPSGLYFDESNLDGAGGTGGGGRGGGGGGSGVNQARLDRADFESDREYQEAVRQFNERQAEDRRQFDISTGEGARQFDLGLGATNRRDVGNLGVDIGRLNLDQQKYIAEILRNPADFLARAFTQRGGQSPFPEITQADLINRLRSEFDRIRNFTGEQLAANSRQLAGPGAGVGGTRLPVAGTQQPRLPVDGAGGGMTAPQPDTAGIGALGTVFNLQPGYQGLTQDQEVAFHQEGLGKAGLDLAAAGDTNVEDWEKVAQDYQNRGYDIPGFAGGTTGPVKGPVRSRLSLVGEEGPEMLINHGDGSFDVVNNEQTEDMFGGRLDDLLAGADDVTFSEHKNGTTSKRQVRMKLSGYRKGTVKNDKSKMFNTGIGDDARLWDLANLMQEFAPTDHTSGAGRASRSPQSNSKPGKGTRLARSAQDDVLSRGTEPAKLLTALIGLLATPQAERRRLAGPSPRGGLPGYEGGTLDGLTPDDLGRLSLFDQVDTSPVTQQQLLQNAQLSTPPGPANVAAGQNAPDLNVTKGSSFKLFSPTQYMSLTPDEQSALGTRLASENRSLGDFLFASQRFFAGRPRQRPRGRLDVTS